MSFVWDSNPSRRKKKKVDGIFSKIFFQPENTAESCCSSSGKIVPVDQKAFEIKS